MAHHLAQFNIARLKDKFESETLRGFREAQDHLNALAAKAKGHVWHLEGEGESSAASFRPYGQEILINFSLWEDLECLKAYTYSGEHLEYLRRRREWFLPIKDRYLVLWWVQKGQIPSLQEAMQRLEHLQKHGASAFAFTMTETFAPPLD